MLRACRVLRAGSMLFGVADSMSKMDTGSYLCLAGILILQGSFRVTGMKEKRPRLNERPGLNLEALVSAASNIQPTTRKIYAAG